MHTFTTNDHLGITVLTGRCVHFFCFILFFWTLMWFLLFLAVYQNIFKLQLQGVKVQIVNFILRGWTKILHLPSRNYCLFLYTIFREANWCNCKFSSLISCWGSFAGNDCLKSWTHGLKQGFFLYFLSKLFIICFFLPNFSGTFFSFFFFLSECTELSLPLSRFVLFLYPKADPFDFLSNKFQMQMPQLKSSPRLFICLYNEEMTVWNGCNSSPADAIFLFRVCTVIASFLRIICCDSQRQDCEKCATVHICLEVTVNEHKVEWGSFSEEPTASLSCLEIHMKLPAAEVKLRSAVQTVTQWWFIAPAVKVTTGAGCAQPVSYLCCGRPGAYLWLI